MTAPERSANFEEPFEARLVRLEVRVEYLQRDVREIKADIRLLADKVQAVRDSDARARN